MDLDLITRNLKSFITRYKTTFDSLARRDTQLLELGALAICAEHYRKKGYSITPQNLFGNQFRVKTTARGYPWNFSWFRVEKDSVAFEIHGNLPVFSFYTVDQGVYVVDVGVIRAGKIPTDKATRAKWVAINNGDLVTFIESKKLVIYPMLLAQFVGIVHEVSRVFLGDRRPHGFKKWGHFNPALISIGYLSGTSNKIIEGFKKRKYHLNILPSFDVEIARLRGGRLTESPFDN